MAWNVYNCLAPAIVNTGGTLTRKGNVLTWSTVTADASKMIVDVAGLHSDISSFDCSPAEGSILDTTQGISVEDTIRTLEGWFPAENFRRDANGRPLSPEVPGNGPFGDNWSEP